MSSFPGCYDPARIGTLFHPDMNAIAAAAAACNLSAVVADERKVHLVIVDMQVDFCHENGSLNVPGSLGDIQRLIEFIYRNGAYITHITCSLDSHLPHQIFHPSWWADAKGDHPAPFTLISLDDVERGRWKPLFEAERSVNYVRTLEVQAKKQLTIWPFHVMIGSIGNALDPELWSAVIWHSLARKTQPTWLTKGSIPLTEHYSIIQPEVPAPAHPLGGKNNAFVEALIEADTVIIAGEAESHCVLETVEDLVEEFGENSEWLDKLVLLRDCTSPVIHPEIDFHAIAVKRFSDFERQGVKVVLSTEWLPY
jgi:nicotinamidase-related amidase